jgi:hypothetical protein
VEKGEFLGLKRTLDPILDRSLTNELAHRLLPRHLKLLRETV